MKQRQSLVLKTNCKTSLSKSPSFKDSAKNSFKAEFSGNNLALDSRVSHFRKSCQMIMHIWDIVMHANLRSCANFHFFSQSFWSPAKRFNFTWRNAQKYKGK